MVEYILANVYEITYEIIEPLEHAIQIRMIVECVSCWGTNYFFHGWRSFFGSSGLRCRGRVNTRVSGTSEDYFRYRVIEKKQKNISVYFSKDSCAESTDTDQPKALARWANRSPPLESSKYTACMFALLQLHFSRYFANSASNPSRVSNCFQNISAAV